MDGRYHCDGCPHARHVPLRQHVRTPEEEQASAAQRRTQLGGAVQEVAQAFQVDSERISGARTPGLGAPGSTAPAHTSPVLLQLLCYWWH